MDPISNVDQIILLLRQKLLERTRSAATERGKVRQQANAEPAAPSAVQQLISLEGVDERQLRRALIQNFLAENFGSSLLNDAQFQQIVSRVTDAIEEDGEASKLIAQVLSGLRSL